MGAINALRQAGKYTTDHWDKHHKPLEVIHHVKASRDVANNIVPTQTNNANLRQAVLQK
jgi:hypothetical protein